MLRKVLSILGTAVFLLFFGLCTVGGISGLAWFAIERPWREDDSGLFALVGILFAASLGVGGLGIAKFLRPDMRQLETDADVAPLRGNPPLLNVVFGTLVLLGGVSATLISRRLAAEQHGLYAIPVGILAAGTLQVGYGLYQLVRFARASQVQRAS